MSFPGRRYGFWVTAINKMGKFFIEITRAASDSVWQLKINCMDSFYLVSEKIRERNITSLKVVFLFSNILEYLKTKEFG